MPDSPCLASRLLGQTSGGRGSKERRAMGLGLNGGRRMPRLAGAGLCIFPGLLQCAQRETLQI
jgi:hypothetical protein